MPIKTYLAGVPPGSILGPFLFTLYLQDFPKVMYAEIARYADDTALFGSSHRPNAIRN